MYKIAVCETNKKHNQAIMVIAQRVCDCSIQSFSNHEELNNCIINGQYIPDILIIGVCLKAKFDGLKIADSLSANHPFVKIIFVSDKLDYVIDAYSVKHFCFVTYNRILDCLPDAIKRACDSVSNDNRTIVTLKVHDEIIRIPTENILFLERRGRITEVRTYRGTYQTRVHPLSIVSECGRCLFVRCHQSYWVNNEKIVKLTSSEIITDKGDAIPVSRTYRKEARNQVLGIVKENTVKN